jgi:ParB family chromosome partitioning protein
VNAPRTTQRRGLGRGLGSLIPTSAPSTEEPTDAAAADGEPHQGPAAVAPDPDGLVPVVGASFAELPIDRISPNAAQPRQVFDEDAMAELVHSIREVGLLQPIVVRRSGEDRYELVMGERRWRAVQQAGLETIPAIIRETEDNDMLRDALLENLHRSQLNPLEEASAYSQLLEDFGCTHEELASRIGRSRPQISNTLRLLNLPLAVQSKVAAGVLSAGHAKAILGLDSAEAMEALAHRVVAEGMSVRSTEEAVAFASAEAPHRSRGASEKRLVPEQAREVAEWLSDRFETRVKVDVGRSKGKITIEFASLQDLQRIADVIRRPEGSHGE